MAARILVADDENSAQRLLTTTLGRGGYQVVAAGDVVAATKAWTSEQPDLVVIGDGLQPPTGRDLAVRIRAEAGVRHVPILVVTEQPDVTDRVRWIRAGADEVLVKPFQAAELLAIVKGLLVRYVPWQVDRGTGPQGRVVAFYGAKGGVGTTTIAINTAVTLRREFGRRVALIDGNLQFGDHRVFLDLGLDRKSMTDVVSAPSIDVELLERVLVRHDTGLDVLLAPGSPELAEMVNQDHLPQIIEQLRTTYEITVVDLDRRLDETNLRVLDIADMVFVVMTADLPSLKNVRLLLETVQSLGYHAEKVRLVLNRANAMTGISVRSAEGALGRKIDYQVGNEYRGAISALNSGNPFLLLRNDLPVKAAIRLLAQAIEEMPVAGEAPKLAAAIC